MREISPELSNFNTCTRNPNPVHTHEPASYHHNGIRVEIRRSHVRPPTSAAAAAPDLDPPLTVEQLQPLHCRRIARRAPLAQGGQAHRCRAKGRERTPLRQVGGECIHLGWDGMRKLGWANEWAERQAGRDEGPQRCGAPGTGRCHQDLVKQLRERTWHRHD